MNLALKDRNKIVDRLILQYNEYIALQNEIEKLQNEKLMLITKDISTNEVDKKIKLLKLDQNQISDEMTFADHIIWMIYKYKAYKGKPNEISNLRQFRNHCSPQGYICTTRYNFLRDYVLKSQSIDIDDSTKFSDDTSLKTFYSSVLMTNLLHDLHFLDQWKSNEYFKSNGLINKWKLK